MAKITCAISGIKFSCSFLEESNIPHTLGYFHPIFALPYKSLHHLYSQHCRGLLTSNDSYLLFTAFMHSSGKIDWNTPASCNPNEQRTKKLIENNLAQLIRVLEQSAVIQHPSFSQPSFKVTFDNSDLNEIQHWIKAWEENIKYFNLGLADIKTRENLQKVENNLSYLILSGEKPEKFSAVIANWASLAAEFPVHKNEDWKRIIRSCFNITKMFNTPLDVLKEIKDYCECNIEAGSIHFHTLQHVLKQGINKHIDYLGGSSFALGYTLLPPNSGIRGIEEIEQNEKLIEIVAGAPDSMPRLADYSNDAVAFIRAKLAYRVKENITASNSSQTNTTKEG